MSKTRLVLFSLANICLGILYGMSNGPYLHLGDPVIPASELMSSGSDDGAGITLALLSFAIAAGFSLASLADWVSARTAAAAFIANYFVYAFLIFLGQLDTSLAESIGLGDWPLVLGLVVPTALFVVVSAGHFRLQGRQQ
jgi:hypothetical protein